MEQKNNEQKTAQILYITIIMILLIMALTVGLVTAANRSKVPAITTELSTQITTTPPEVTTASTTTASITTTPTVTTAQSPQSVTPPAVTTAHKPTAVEPAKPTLPEFIMPTAGTVAKDFSIDTLVYSNTMEDYRTHNGIDIACGIGNAVSAAADGIVTKVYENPMMGYTVVISHDGDAETVYQNLAEEITVSVGDTVKCGDVIGAVGESALIEIAEEPHLHFEMCIAGERVNPSDYISEAKETIFYEE